MSKEDNLAKMQAIQDIKDELKKERKAFMLFRKNLNPVMDELVRRHYLMANK